MLGETYSRSLYADNGEQLPDDPYGHNIGVVAVYVKWLVFETEQRPVKILSYKRSYRPNGDYYWERVRNSTLNELIKERETVRMKELEANA